MKLPLSLLTTFLVLSGVNVAQAQMKALNALGRYCGWGVSDGYHVNRGGCGPQAECGTCTGCAAKTLPPSMQPQQHGWPHFPAHAGQPMPAMQPWPQQFIPSAGTAWPQQGMQQPVHAGQFRPVSMALPYQYVSPGSVPYGVFSPHVVSPNLVSPNFVQPPVMWSPPLRRYEPVSFW